MTRSRAPFGVLGGILLLLSPGATAQTVGTLSTAAPVSDTLNGKNDVRYYAIPIASTDPLLITVKTTDDLAGLSVLFRVDSTTGGGTGRLRGSLVRRGATTQQVYEIVSPDPKTKYFMEILSQADGAHPFTVDPIETRPVQTVTGKDPFAGPSLNGIGDVRYFRFQAATDDPLLIHVTTSDDLGTYGIYMHQDALTGGGTGRVRATLVHRGITDQAVYEIVYPDPKTTYYLEVTSLATGTRTFAFEPFETRPVIPFPGDQPLGGPTLHGKGDVRYFRFGVDTKDPFLLTFVGSDALGEYGIYLHQSALTGGGDGRFRGDTIHNKISNEGLYEVPYPNPDIFYYLEVTNLDDGDRDFALQPIETRPIGVFTTTDPFTGPVLEKHGDVRYYKFNVGTKDPFLLRYRSAGDLGGLSLYLHQDAITGGGVGRLRGVTPAVGTAHEALIEVPNPDPNVNYYLEFTDPTQDPQSFSVLPLDYRPVAPIQIGQVVTDSLPLGNGDVRYYQLNVGTKDPFTIQFRGTDPLQNYGVYLHQDALTGGGVGRIVAQTANGYTATVDQPDPNKPYYLEIASRGDGARGFTFTINGTLPPAPVYPPHSGDANGDGKTDVSDAALLLRFIVKAIDLSPDQQKAADANGDGVVNLTDVIAILRKAVGL